MKKYLSVVVTMVFLSMCFVIPVSATTPEIQNGSFETGDTREQLGWTLGSGGSLGSAGPRYKLVEGVSKSGNKSFLFDIDSDATIAHYITKEITGLQVGELYEVTGYFMPDNLNDDAKFDEASPSKCTRTAQMLILNGDGTTIKYQRWFRPNASYVGQWNKMVIAFRATSETQYVRATYIGGMSKCYFDDFSVKNGGNLISPYNANFEEALNDYSNTYVNLTTKPRTMSVSIGTALDNIDPKEGKYSLKLSNGSTTYKAGVTELNKAGKYKLTFWIKSDTINEDVIYFNEKRTIGTTTPSTPQKKFQVSKAGEWEQKVYYIDEPEDLTSTQLNFGSITGTSVWLDDIVIEEAKDEVFYCKNDTVIVSANKGESVTGRAFSTNSTGFTYIVGIYEEIDSTDKLINSYVVTGNSGENVETTITMPDGNGKYKVKSFIWNGLNAVIPLADMQILALNN